MSIQDDPQDNPQSQNATQDVLNNAELPVDAEKAEAMIVNRRQFLLSLGKWSLAVIGGIVGHGALSPEASAWVNHGNLWVNRGGNSGRWMNGQLGGGWNNRSPVTQPPWNNSRWVNRYPAWNNRGGGWINRNDGWSNGSGEWINRGDRWVNQGGGWVNRGGSWVNGQGGSWANGQGGSWANGYNQHRDNRRGRGRWVNRY